MGSLKQQKRPINKIKALIAILKTGFFKKISVMAMLLTTFYANPA